MGGLTHRRAITEKTIAIYKPCLGFKPGIDIQVIPNLFITFDNHYNLCLTWETLTLVYANNKGADQPVYTRSLINAF